MENACICRKDVSESTISRFLNKESYYYLQARKKGLLTKADMKKRRTFAGRMQNGYSHDVWTQDIAFYLDGTGVAYKRNPLDQALAPKGRVWRKRSEGLTPGCTAKGKKTGTGGRVVKLMVAISYDKGRGGSRGRQTSHATNVKIANLIKVLNIRPIVQLFFIMQRHLIIVQYLLSCSGSN